MPLYELECPNCKTRDIYEIVFINKTEGEIVLYCENCKKKSTVYISMNDT